MPNTIIAKKDYLWKYVLDPETNEVALEPIIFLPKTTTDCVYFEDKDTTLDDYLKDLRINEEYGGIVIKDNAIGETTTYSSAKIEQMVAQAIITAQTSSTINGLRFSIIDGTLAVTYDDTADNSNYEGNNQNQNQNNQLGPNLIFIENDGQ